MINPLHYFLCQFATLGPIGESLPAPGTAGSLVAIILGYYLLPFGWLPFLVLTVLVTVLGVLAADIYKNDEIKHKLPSYA